MTPCRFELPEEPKMVMFWICIDTLSPASSRPWLGEMATPARSPNPTTNACQSSSSGPVFTKFTNWVCWSPLQPSRTLLGSTCSQPDCKKGEVVGETVAVGLGRAVGVLSAVLGGVDRRVEP